MQSKYFAECQDSNANTDKVGTGSGLLPRGEDRCEMVVEATRICPFSVYQLDKINWLLSFDSSRKASIITRKQVEIQLITKGFLDDSLKASI